jgi:putative FmdB family regulatory protein
MPIYAYRCSNCGHAQDVLQRMADPVLTACPACGQATYVKQVTAAGFQLKGSGWYVTDFRGDNKPGKTAEAGDAAKNGGKDAGTGAEKNGDASAGGAGAKGEGKSAESGKKAETGKTGEAAPAPAAAPAAAPASTPAAPAPSGKTGS